MKINLVENGIFPITKDANGLPIKGALDTGLSLAGTVQGEGKLLGTSCIFIRTSGCNLRCSWVGVDGNGSPCDTPYSSHAAENNFMEIDDVVKTINHNIGNLKHIVISGGEPTMQRATSKLAEELHDNYHLTIETNATLYADSIAKYFDLISMSPKLSSSTPEKTHLKNTGIEYSEQWAKKHEKKRKNIEVIQKYITNSKAYGNDFQLKFVVQNPRDIIEIEEDYLQFLSGYESDDIVLMPEGTSAEFLAERSTWVIEKAIERGWRFTPRLHIDLFGKARAV